MLYPFTFQPIFQERIWGGRNLERLYRKALPPGIKIGESWEISDRAEAQSIITNGEFAGKSLRWLMENHHEALLGNARTENGRFPLLVKILDAQEKLSLQVHPPPHKAASLGGEPKTEMWYITHAEPGASLYVGLRPGATRQKFEAGIREGSVAECFHQVTVESGDAMFLPSGRVHAIGAGLVIFEIQQNSDTTYRVFDWNRTDASGKGRQLHVRESLECIDFADIAPEAIRGREKLVDHDLFSVELRTVGGQVFERRIHSACVVAVVSGEAEINSTVRLPAGGFALVPASSRTVRVQGGTDTKVLLAIPG